MKKEIHPESKIVDFNCSSCNTKISLMSTLKVDKVSIDVCGKCHPFYMGNMASKQVRGRAEKFAKKFEMGKNQISSTKKTKKEISSKTENKKIIKSLDNL